VSHMLSEIYFLLLLFFFVLFSPLPFEEKPARIWRISYEIIKYNKGGRKYYSYFESQFDNAGCLFIKPQNWFLANIFEIIFISNPMVCLFYSENVWG